MSEIDPFSDDAPIAPLVATDTPTEASPPSLSPEPPSLPASRPSPPSPAEHKATSQKAATVAAAVEMGLYDYVPGAETKSSRSAVSQNANGGPSTPVAASSSSSSSSSAATAVVVNPAKIASGYANDLEKLAKWSGAKWYANIKPENIVVMTASQKKAADKALKASKQRRGKRGLNVSAEASAMAEAERAEQESEAAEGKESKDSAAPPPPPAAAAGGGTGERTDWINAWDKSSATSRNIRYVRPFMVVRKPVLGYGAWKGVPEFKEDNMAADSLGSSKTSILFETSKSAYDAYEGGHVHWKAVQEFIKWRNDMQAAAVRSAIVNGSTAYVADIRKALCEQKAKETFSSWQSAKASMDPLLASGDIKQAAYDTAMATKKREWQQSKNWQPSHDQLFDAFMSVHNVNWDKTPAAGGGTYCGVEAKLFREPNRDEKAAFETCPPRQFVNSTIADVWEKQEKLWNPPGWKDLKPNPDPRARTASWLQRTLMNGSIISCVCELGIIEWPQQGTFRFYDKIIEVLHYKTPPPRIAGTTEQRDDGLIGEMPEFDAAEPSGPKELYFVTRGWQVKTEQLEKDMDEIDDDFLNRIVESAAEKAKEQDRYFRTLVAPDPKRTLKYMHGDGPMRKRYKEGSGGGGGDEEDGSGPDNKRPRV